MEVFSFPPIESSDANILILGTMPGKTSLEINEYYGYKHNKFWKIMFDIFDMNFSHNYYDRLNLLISKKIALWDTLKFCEREGSLDSAIKKEIPNDFEGFYKKHKDISTILFNGLASFKFYKRYVGLNDLFKYHTLPSTSPANARKNYEEKLSEWQVIIKILNEK